MPVAPGSVLAPLYKAPRKGRLLKGTQSLRPREVKRLAQGHVSGAGRVLTQVGPSPPSHRPKRCCGWWARGLSWLFPSASTFGETQGQEREGEGRQEREGGFLV